MCGWWGGGVSEGSRRTIHLPTHSLSTHVADGGAVHLQVGVGGRVGGDDLGGGKGGEGGRSGAAAVWLAATNAHTAAWTRAQALGGERVGKRRPQRAAARKAPPELKSDAPARTSPPLSIHTHTHTHTHTHVVQLLDGQRAQRLDLGPVSALWRREGREGRGGSAVRASRARKFRALLSLPRPPSFCSTTPRTRHQRPLTLSPPGVVEAAGLWEGERGASARERTVVCALCAMCGANSSARRVLARPRPRRGVCALGQL